MPKANLSGLTIPLSSAPHLWRVPAVPSSGLVVMGLGIGTNLTGIGTVQSGYPSLSSWPLPGAQMETLPIRSFPRIIHPSTARAADWHAIR